MRDGEFGAWLRSGAAEIGASADPPAPEAIRRRGDRRRRRMMITSGMLAAAMGAGGGGAAYASLAQPGRGLSPASAQSAQAARLHSPSPSTGPEIVAVTTGGAVEVLDRVTGIARQVLVPRVDAIGDAIAVSPGGATVYFAVKRGCADYIESVPASGGTPRQITAGVLPAISPDGTRLAFVREPVSGGPQQVQYGCLAGSAQPGKQPGEQPGKQFQVVVRDLSTGREKTYPAPPGEAASPPFPVSHLSWAPSGAALLVSAGPAQDNDGWGLSVLDVATARYYLPPGWPAPGPLNVPVTGQPGAGKSYYREGVYLPDGGIFVNRVCCRGVPVSITSSLLQEISVSGRLLRQVTIGFKDRDHTSLDGSGSWLLYLSGRDLYLCGGRHVPYKLTTGLIAAAWLP